MSGVLIAFASVLVLNAAGAQGGVVGIAIPGYLPGESVRAHAPEADNNPNDIYSHLPVRGPVYNEDIVILYPKSIFGLDNTQDPERRAYQTYSPEELAAVGHPGFDQHGVAPKGYHHDHHGKKTARSIVDPDQSIFSDGMTLGSTYPYPYVQSRR
ncbi:uncharacterized protein LOC143030948 [Oratosquilla oratoria]|uniref:uncharacterized protein LOC143030948 n=1 Tax=Oratosquilla oratoria TaxID=337810 RepID=UPI003F7742CC